MHEFVWSDHAAHGLTLFRAWQPGDGYPESILRAAAISLGIGLPGVLHSFYRSWGKRTDLTRVHERLLTPQQLIVRSGVLVVCVENQSIVYWGIPLAAANGADPPVYVASSKDEDSVGTGDSDLEWGQSHDHLSDFFDALIYHHAFAGGSMHGGSSYEPPDEERVVRVQRQWRRTEVNSVPFYLDRESSVRRWPLYVRDGQALDWGMQFAAAVRDEANLDQIGRELDITWKSRW